MFIVMHCGGLPFNGDTIKTKSLGGSESAAYYMARELVKQGHHVTIFTNSTESGVFDGVKYEWSGNPYEATPLGDRFTFYAENTPHDVCIIQRHPQAFSRKFASKINLLWLHDLALYRSKDAVIGQMWNVDGVLCVSDYHRKQVSKVYGIPETSIYVVNNGVDLELYRATPRRLDMLEGFSHVFYSSRPERGLVHLVRQGGIMERLQAAGAKVMLHVCGYENTTPDMRDYYDALNERCAALPNVINHGSLTKYQLASLQKACDAWVYPTEFEEVSCITAMEAMAADCAIITTNCAALPETCAPYDNAILFNMNDDGSVNEEKFFQELSVINSRSTGLKDNNGCSYTWEASANSLLRVISDIFHSTNPLSVAHHFMRHSDIPAFELVREKLPLIQTTLGASLENEYQRAYGFYRDSTYPEHYAAYYQYEKDRGVNYGAEDVSGTTRFQTVASHIANLPAGSIVLDYGCAHGHYTVALAHLFKHLTFIGADLAQSNIDTATKWAEDEGLTNIKFIKVEGAGVLPDEVHADLIIAAEVVEHVGNPQELINNLMGHLEEAGRMVITVPYGAWEAQGYREHGYWRAHLHHFERADLFDMLGHFPDYKIVAAPSGKSKFHSVLGSYIVTFTKPENDSCRKINYARKLAETMPDQTVSCCMIVKDAERDIQRCLESVLPYVQEVVIGIDEATTDNTKQVIDKLRLGNPLVAFNAFSIPKVTETGFAAARNSTIDKASCDWILWIDADEVLTHGEMLGRFTRNSMYNGFAVKQHHMSQDPVGVIKVDLPCRLFRNGKGIKFFGAVHEHPEITLNEGIGAIAMMQGAEIIHYGYHDERVRRGRFDRNLPLLKRDREELPERILGKFLWLRDLAQANQYDMEAGVAQPAVVDARIAEGIKLFEELLESKNYRIIIDALPFYSQLNIMRGEGVAFSFVVNASLAEHAELDNQQKVEGYFTSEDHAKTLMVGLAMDKLGTQERRYL